MLAAYILFTGWQATIVFMESSDEGMNTYIGLSGLFLTQNGVCATLIFFLNFRSKNFTMKAIFDKYLDDHPSLPNNDMNRDLRQEILKQHQNDDWYPSRDEITTYISIGKISTNKQSSALGAGIQTFF